MKTPNHQHYLLALPCLPVLAQAQLTITPAPLKLAGQKAVVSLALNNKLGERIESARSSLFLLDDHGKMVAQASRWIIGGDSGSTNKSSLASGATNVFHFVVTADKPFETTNLTTKITVSRLVLEGGKSGNLPKDIIIQESSP